VSSQTPSAVIGGDRERLQSAAAWLVSDALMFAVMNLIVRMNVTHIDPKVALFLRYAFSIPIIALAIRLTESRGVPAYASVSKWDGRIVLRVALCALTALISNVAWYQAIGILSLSVATTIFYTKALFLVLLAALLFKERVRTHHVIACAAGLSGVFLIAGTGGTASRGGIVLVLISSLTSALMILQIKSISSRLTPLRLTLALTVIGAPLSLLIAIPVWSAPSFGMLLCLAFVALLSVGIHIAIAHAYRYVRVAPLAPLDFLRLVFVVILEFSFLGLTVPIAAWCGAALILSGLILNYAQESRSPKAWT
jgi:drug/metabolite transporter (DMT)-like permease